MDPTALEAIKPLESIVIDEEGLSRLNGNANEFLRRYTDRAFRAYKDSQQTELYKRMQANPEFVKLDGDLDAALFNAGAKEILKAYSPYVRMYNEERERLLRESKRPRVSFV